MPFLYVAEGDLGSSIGPSGLAGRVAKGWNAAKDLRGGKAHKRPTAWMPWAHADYGHDEASTFLTTVWLGWAQARISSSASRPPNRHPGGLDVE